MRIARNTLAATVALLVAGATAAAGQEQAAVDIVDNTYEPTQLTVTAGDTVTWTHAGSLPHSVTADDAAFDSSPECGAGGACMSAGDTFSSTFDEPGEYPYYCRLHGAAGGVGMSGVIVVTAAGATEEPTTSPTTEPDTSEPDATAPPTEEAAPVTGAISVSDQTGDGTRVTVDSVTIEGADGFVVIHLDDGGAPGRVVGHVAVPEGTTTDLAVPLDAALTEDTTVWPMLHVDAGTPGTYEFPGADGPVMADGAVVMAPLTLTLATDDSTTLPRTGPPSPLLVLLAVSALVAGGLTLRRRAGLR